MSSKKMSKNIVQDPGNVVHNENIKNVSMISGDNEEIQTNKYLLSVFSPSLRNLLSSPLDTYQNIFLPDSPHCQLEISLILSKVDFLSQRKYLMKISKK